jgi:hypothetical protein
MGGVGTILRRPFARSAPISRSYHVDRVARDRIDSGRMSCAVHYARREIKAGKSRSFVGLSHTSLQPLAANVFTILGHFASIRSRMNTASSMARSTKNPLAMFGLPCPSLFQFPIFAADLSVGHGLNANIQNAMKFKPGSSANKHQIA